MTSPLLAEKEMQVFTVQPPTSRTARWAPGVDAHPVGEETVSVQVFTDGVWKGLTIMNLNGASQIMDIFSKINFTISQAESANPMWPTYSILVAGGYFLFTWRCVDMALHMLRYDKHEMGNVYDNPIDKAPTVLATSPVLWSLAAIVALDTPANIRDIATLTHPAKFTNKHYFISEPLGGKLVFRAHAVHMPQSAEDWQFECHAGTLNRVPLVAISSATWAMQLYLVVQKPSLGGVMNALCCFVALVIQVKNMCQFLEQAQVYADRLQHRLSTARELLKKHRKQIRICDELQMMLATKDKLLKKVRVDPLSDAATEWADLKPKIESHLQQFEDIAESDDAAEACGNDEDNGVNEYVSEAEDGEVHDDHLQNEDEVHDDHVQNEDEVHDDHVQSEDYHELAMPMECWDEESDEDSTVGLTSEDQRLQKKLPGVKKRRETEADRMRREVRRWETKGEVFLSSSCAKTFGGSGFQCSALLLFMAAIVCMVCVIALAFSYQKEFVFVAVVCWLGFLCSHRDFISFTCALIGSEMAKQRKYIMCLLLVAALAVGACTVLRPSTADVTSAHRGFLRWTL